MQSLWVTDGTVSFYLTWLKEKKELSLAYFIRTWISFRTILHPGLNYSLKVLLLNPVSLGFRIRICESGTEIGTTAHGNLKKKHKAVNEDESKTYPIFCNTVKSVTEKEMYPNKCLCYKNESSWNQPFNPTPRKFLKSTDALWGDLTVGWYSDQPIEVENVARENAFNTLRLPMSWISNTEPVYMSFPLGMVGPGGAGVHCSCVASKDSIMPRFTNWTRPTFKKYSSY